MRCARACFLCSFFSVFSDADSDVFSLIAPISAWYFVTRSFMSGGISMDASPSAELRATGVPLALTIPSQSTLERSGMVLVPTKMRGMEKTGVVLAAENVGRVSAMGIVLVSATTWRVVLAFPDKILADDVACWLELAT